MVYMSLRVRYTDAVAVEHMACRVVPGDIRMSIPFERFDFMFGFRPDGRRIAQDDPILAFAPYLMPQRVDAQVHIVLKIDCDVLTNYIRAQREKGYSFSFMDLVAAGYVRSVSQNPELNRFISNKQLYARNSITVSFALLKKFDDSDEIKETTAKINFNPTDTVYDVHNKLRKAIDDNRKPENKNSADKIASFLMRVPGLPTFVVSVVRVLDRYGIIPRFLVNASPFHTGLFITNMASLGLPHVNHHIYNFGNTSLFLAIGRTERVPTPGPDGTTIYKRMMPIGVVTDERVTSGAEFGRAFGCWRDLLADPSLMEMPPEDVKVDFPPEKMPGFRRNRRREEKQRAAMEA